MFVLVQMFNPILGIIVIESKDLLKGWYIFYRDVVQRFLSVPAWWLVEPLFSIIWLFPCYISFWCFYQFYVQSFVLQSCAKPRSSVLWLVTLHSGPTEGQRSPADCDLDITLAATTPPPGLIKNTCRWSFMDSSPCQGKSKAELLSVLLPESSSVMRFTCTGEARWRYLIITFTELWGRVSDISILCRCINTWKNTWSSLLRDSQ